jgi:hypothetical protein
MSNSYRIRTTPGVDKSIKVRIDQDFEYLEILSLKLLQSEVYTRKCSDYGVIVGRVSVNNGFGVPNAKVSIFIPLSSDDEANNPIIADLYPYKTLSQVNDIGYRYNLLPSEQSYSNHVPTGSFFTRKDVLTNQTKIEIYDKYYKYNTVTNESGDYMIFGIPVGSQTIVVNVDLSDIGEFSLSPQDLVRMGVATPAQVDGTKFKSSTNLNELPQIITLNRTLEVEPLWGDETLCNLGITRTDFDLSAEKNINIQPTSIFMGSIISSNDDQPLKRLCKPSLKSGTLCNLVAGPGQIQAIRQTIYTDVNGRPGLEVAPLEEGGQVIDDNGAWMFDVPMNLDYVVTNEFGEQVISKDPKKGIPTKGKYRFKVMWNQPTDLGERIKRANFLVPNIKEYGWDTASNRDPLTGQPAGSKQNFGNKDNPCNYDSTVPTTNNGRAAKASYAYSLDWEDYGEKNNAGVLTPLGNQMILEGINCEDRFFEMKYNKVYTVSQLISEYRKGASNNRIISIKNILDDTCESTNNKFPTNDGMYRIDIIFLLFQFLMFVLYPVLFILVLLAHIFFWVLCNIILPVLKFLKNVICGLADAICSLKDKCFLNICPFGFLSGICNKLNSACVSLTESVASLEDKCKNSFLKLPNITYPDCEICACEPQPAVDGKPDSGNALNNFNSEQGSNSAFADLMNTGSYAGPITKNSTSWDAASNGYFGLGKVDDRVLISGNFIQTPKVGSTRGMPTDIPSDSGGLQFGDGGARGLSSSTDLPWHERFNLFNTKAKYFNNNNTSNPGGGVNRIAVRFNANMNGGHLPTGDFLNPQGLHHLDNVIAVLVDADQSDSFKIGNMLTFVDPELTGDMNLKNVIPLNDFGTNSITGSTIGTPINPKVNQTTVTVNYANPNGNGSDAPSAPTYVITGDSANSYHKYPMDLEYFQVIDNVSVDDYISVSEGKNPDFPNSFYSRVIKGGYNIFTTYIGVQSFAGGSNGYSTFRRGLYSTIRSGQQVGGNTVQPIIEYIKDGKKLRIVFLVRGVDPNSPKTTISYDFSRLYGKTNYGHVVKTVDNVRMNVPIKGGFKCVNHKNITTNTDTDSYSGLKLYYDSYMWLPAQANLGVPVKNDESKEPPVPYNPVTLDPEYRPNGWCDWKPFSVSKSGHTFYSALDESILGPVLGSFTNQAQNNNGVRILGGNGYNHDFTSYESPGSCQGPIHFEGTDYPPDAFWNWVSYKTSKSSAADNGTKSQLTYARQNSGYFINESVEGGNLGLLRTITFNNPCWTDAWRQAYPEQCPCTYNDNQVDKNLVESSYYASYTYMSYYGDTLNVNFSSLGSNGRQIVMRSDRLPASSSEDRGTDKVSYTMMANNNFSFFIISDDGTVTSLVGGESVEGVGNSADSAAANAADECGDNILNTFTCEGLIPLDCYHYEAPKVTFWKKEDPIPATGSRDGKGCYGNGLTGSGTFGAQPESIMEGGCYRLVTKAFSTLTLDWALLSEWKSRMIITFAACRNVFSHSFTNNWINGTLYAFSFVNSRRFTSPIDPDPNKRNKPYNCYCKNNIYFNTDSNNFYYRSSPFSTNGEFSARPNPVNWFTGKGFGGNERSLMFPTTIMDMGPRDVYTQEIVFSNDYDGYVMNNLNTTTFQDVSDLLNVFIITRITNRTFIQKMIGGAGVTGYFSRNNLKIDGDYAQSISINSELGIEGFDADSYSSCDIYYNGGNLDNGIFGIYYSANTQVRDFVSPKRTIISEEKPSFQTDCAFEYFNVKTQNVPYYQWYVKKNFTPNGDDKDPNPGSVLASSPPDSIFGSQLNDWSTKTYSGNTFFSYQYQKLDRLDKNSRYTRTKGEDKSKNFRANIYSVDNTGKQSADVQYWDLNAAPDSSKSVHTLFQRVINTGAPYHFYFGLNKGKSAFDRFTKKWIDTEITTD